MLTEKQTRFVLVFKKVLFIFTLRLYFALQVVIKKACLQIQNFYSTSYNNIAYIEVVEKQHFHKKPHYGDFYT
jgi:hypothetical protein